MHTHNMAECVCGSNDASREQGGSKVNSVHTAKCMNNRKKKRKSKNVAGKQNKLRQLAGCIFIFSFSRFTI